MTSISDAVPAGTAVAPRQNLLLFARGFVAVCCVVVWLPFAIDFGGLNVRASQLLLPVLLVLLWMQKPFVSLSRRELALALSGGLWLGATLFWTIAAGGGSAKPVARVFLHGINLLHFAVAYIVVVRIRSAHAPIRTMLTTIAVLNLLILVIASLANSGVPVPTSFLAEEAAPLAVEGAVVAGSVRRFSVGVVVGCVSAAAFVLGLALLLSPRRGRVALLVTTTLAGVGMVVGFSRQGILSLGGGLAVVIVCCTRRKQLLQLVRTVVLTVVLLAVVSGIVWVTPGGQEYFQALGGRTAQLTQPEAYATGTVLERTSLWLQMLADVRANPLVGRGQDAYREYSNPWEEGSHNFPLEVLHAAGLGGFIPFVVFHLLVGVGALVAIFRARRAGPTPLALVGLLGAYTAVTLATASNLIFWTPVYWLVGGLLGGATTLQEQDTRARTARGPAAPAGTA
ncbi:MAG: O-antigen ligase family protein [Gemmatimonadales bacterium]